MSTGHGEKLSRKREQAIAALLQHPSVVAAATAAGVAEATLRRWLKDEAFSEAYKSSQRDCLSHATGRLQEVTAKAITTLGKVMDNGKSGAQVSAARTILEFAFRAVEHDELEKRLAALEAR